MTALNEGRQDRHDERSSDSLPLGTVLGGMVPPYEVDLDRLVWDPEYREDIRRQIKTADEAA